MADFADELTSVMRQFQLRFQETGDANLPATFEHAVAGFLGQHLGEPHAFAQYFDRIAAVSEDLADAGRFHDALDLWRKVQAAIGRWEAGSEEEPGFRPVHMGTPYYFSGGIHFRMGNPDHGMLLMHLAFEQDNRNMPGEETPARRFITLDAGNPNQYLRPIVASLSEFLNYRLDWYRTFAEPPESHGYGTLTWDEFRERFLGASGEAMATAAFFVFAVSKVRGLWTLWEAFRASRFSARLFENALLNMCIVFEELVRPKYAAVHEAGPVTMGPLIVFLAQQTDLAIGESELRKVRADRNHDFDGTITRLVTGRYPGANWRIEEDLLTMYAVRDPAAHEVRPLTTAITRFQFLADSIVRSVFFVVERLYA